MSHLLQPAPGSPVDPVAPNWSAAPDWWQAQTLHERLTSAVATSDAELGAKRLARWRKETPGLDEATFAARLQAEGTSVEHLAALLGEPAGALHARSRATLPWLDDLRQAYGAEAEQTTGTVEAEGFAAVIAPLVGWARRRLRERVQARTVAAAAALAAGESALVEVLMQQLPRQAERTLVLAMHVARLQGQLDGETPEARFAAFGARLRDRAQALALLEEYPVLARQLVTRTRQTVEAINEILVRLAGDWAVLQATFGRSAADGNGDGAGLGHLTRLELGAGDTHAGGRAVAILHFAGDVRVVYKPRSLAVDTQFQTLLRWLNGKGATPAFRTLTLLDRGAYGWVEFVAAAACPSPAAVERFYRRQGGYLALLYALSAADFHFENLIAAGEHPVLIDLEALFHPDTVAFDLSHPEQLARAAMDQSVLSIGMLPQRLRFHADAAAIDISGIGAADRQMTPDKLPVWEGVGTDEMRLTRQHVAFRSAGHRPQLGAAAVDPAQYGEAVAAGFDGIYGLLLRHRDELMAVDGPLAGFAAVQVRVVARATRTYSLLLQESTHPDLLRNGLDRDRLFARLWKDVDAAPNLARLLAAERYDLNHGDVPIFHTKPGTRTLWDSQGNAIPDYLPESGMERVRGQLARLGEADRIRQLWTIRAAFATLRGGSRHAHGQPDYAQLDQGQPAHTSMPQADGGIDAQNPATWMEAARAIGDRLAWQAYRTETHAVWIGLGLEQGEWSLAPLTMHLYDGHAGVALFLAYLGKLTGEARYTGPAQAALATTLVQAEPLQASFPYVGAFNGWGGLIYTLTHLGRLWDRLDLWDKAHELAAVAARHVAQDEQFDIIGGAAGCIGAAAALYRQSGDVRLVALMAACADHLVAHAQPQAAGVGWVVPNMGGAALAGFSHGAAGIAWALYTAAQYTGTSTYGRVAAAALAYERWLYDPVSMNWRDLRRDEQAGHAPEQHDPAHDDTAMLAWCHGAPGVGLARLGLLDAGQTDQQLRDEAEIALAATLERGFGGGHSLCHGDMGNLDLLVKGAETLGDPALLHRARQIGGRVLAQQTQRGWVCGVPGGIETPGLMVGLAGIGYEFLRLADPAQVPALLVLEGPP